MLEVKRNYESGWFDIYKRELTSPLEINSDYFKSPFEHLPKKIILTSKEEKLLKELKARRGWTRPEFIALQRLREKEGVDEANFRILQEDLKKLVVECEKLDIKLPKHFLEFYNNQEYVSRFRTDDLTFLSLYNPIAFPEDKNYYLLPFFGDSQGFCWWYLLLNEKSEHCILYNNYFWNEDPVHLQPHEPLPKYIICAESFGEFLTKLSYDVRSRDERKGFG